MNAFWMTAASFLFACMGVCVKLGSSVFSIAELVFARGAVATLILTAYVAARRLPLTTPHGYAHFLRGIAGFSSLVCYFFAIGMIPLATAVTLSYTSPLFLAVLLAFWRRETAPPALYLALALGFVGIVFLLQPMLVREQWLGGTVGLAAGAISSFAYLNVRRLGELGEPEWRTVFYFSLLSTLASLPWLLYSGMTVPADASAWGLLIGIGAFGAGAQLCMTTAYKRGKTLATAGLAYSTVVFSSLFGLLLWDEVLSLQALIGVAVIVGSGVATTAISWRGPSTPLEHD